MKKSILITGAFGGMGRATAIAAAKLGYRGFALDRKVSEGIDEEDIIPIELDLTDSESVRAAFDKVKLMTDSLCAIVHFAGVYMLDSLLEISDEDFERIFKINLGGVFLVNKIFLPLLEGGAKILITTSELAPLDPLPFTGIYAITKSALDKYAYSLRMELQLKDIYVSVLRAGAVSTGMLGASTTALDRFCKETKLYSCNAKKFKQVVDSVEARSIVPEKIAAKVIKILSKRKPGFAYSINRNPLLLLLNALPWSLQLFAIRKILENKEEKPGKNSENKQG